jgi:AraC-like DNA-binding protein
MEYREYVPLARLSSFLECMWTLEGHSRELAGEMQPVLPDGRPEVVLHFGDPFERFNDVEGDSPGDGGAMRQPDAIFAGQLAGRLLLRPTGRVSVLGVRFRPHGAAAIVREPQNRLVGLTLDAASVSVPLARSATIVLESARSLAEAVPLMQEQLVALLSTSSMDPRVARAVAAIERSGGLVGIDELAVSIDTTRRHLERLFLQSVGMSPKRLARVTRFQRAVGVLEGGGAGSGALAAHACGYADQAHFIRDFRELAGCSPGVHLLERAELTGFFTRATAPPDPRSWR